MRKILQKTSLSTIRSVVTIVIFFSIIFIFAMEQTYEADLLSLKEGIRTIFDISTSAEAEIAYVSAMRQPVEDTLEKPTAVNANTSAANANTSANASSDSSVPTMAAIDQPSIVPDPAVIEEGDFLRLACVELSTSGEITGENEDPAVQIDDVTTVIKAYIEGDLQPTESYSLDPSKRYLLLVDSTIPAAFKGHPSPYSQHTIRCNYDTNTGLTRLDCDAQFLSYERTPYDESIGQSAKQVLLFEKPKADLPYYRFAHIGCFGAFHTTDGVWAIDNHEVLTCDWGSSLSFYDHELTGVHYDHDRIISAYLIVGTKTSPNLSFQDFDID